MSNGKMACTSCGNEYESDGFYKSKTRKIKTCKACLRKRSKQRRADNPDLLRSQDKARYENNQEKRIAASVRYEAKRYASDPSFRRAKMARTSLRRAVRNAASSMNPDYPTCCGCSRGELKAHIESMFRDGMRWENYGIHWNLDHIIPISNYDLVDKRNEMAANHWTNIRPMLCGENTNPGKKYV